MDTSTSLALNLLLRGGTMLTCLHIAIAMLRDYPGVVAARVGAAFACGAGVFVVNSIPGFAAHPAWWHAPLIAIDSGNMFVFWLFTRALLDDTFALRLWHGAVWCALATVGLLNCFVFASNMPALAGLGSLLLTLSTVFLAALSVAQSIATWREDLVEGRRRLRMLLIASAAGYSMLMAGVALASGNDALAVFSSTANAFGIALLSLLVALQLTRAAGNDLFAPPQSHGVRKPKAADSAWEPGRSDSFAAAPAADPAPPDPVHVQALQELMAEQRLYREEKLTVSSLAERMGLPEHRLRKLINQGLGYRNFNVFLNSYRIDEVSQALSDPTQAEVPVLEMALEAGFQSIGPFNRAFKAMTGQTPTEFRRSKGAMAVE